MLSCELRKICEVQQRDQTEQSSSEEITCDVCHRGDNEELLLLCDGRRGRCPGACHSYCDGMGNQVPRGRWLCFACRPARKPKSKPKSRPTAKAKSAATSAAPAAPASQLEAVGVAVKVEQVEKVEVEKQKSVEQPESLPREVQGSFQGRVKNVKRERLETEAQPSGASTRNPWAQREAPSRVKEEVGEIEMNSMDTKENDILNGQEAKVIYNTKKCSIDSSHGISTRS